VRFLRSLVVLVDFFAKSSNFSLAGFLADPQAAMKRHLVRYFVETSFLYRIQFEVAQTDVPSRRKVTTEKITQPILVKIKATFSGMLDDSYITFPTEDNPTAIQLGKSKLVSLNLSRVARVSLSNGPSAKLPVTKKMYNCASLENKTSALRTEKDFSQRMTRNLYFKLINRLILA
jgi:hypothetical protein